MEDLTKQQIILLALLVSFVTSIATGIITFSLISEAPVGVTQTINRVVERTIETVVPPSDSKTPDGDKVTVRETVIVKEEDRVIEVIQKNNPVIVRIYRGEVATSTSFISLGFVISAKGIVLADAGGFTDFGSYNIKLHDEKIVSASVLKHSAESGVVFFSFDPKDTNIKSATLGNSGVQLGQSVVAIGGDDKNKISVSRVTEIKKDGETQSAVYLETNQLNDSGSVLVNLSGEIVGIRLSSFFKPLPYYTTINSITSSFPSEVGASVGADENVASVGNAL